MEAGRFSIFIFLVYTLTTSSMNGGNNNDYHNNDCRKNGSDTIYIAFQHEDLLYCEYTNRLLINKELF